MAMCVPSQVSSKKTTGEKDSASTQSKTDGKPQQYHQRTHAKVLAKNDAIVANDDDEPGETQTENGTMTILHNVHMTTYSQ
jgi:hypothetical protein